MPFDKTQLYDFYNSELRHALLTQERLRKRSRGVFLGVAAALVVLNIVFGILLIGSSRGVDLLMNVLLAIGFTAAQVWGVYEFSSRTFRQAFKTNVVKKLVAFVSPDLRYAPHSYVPQSKFVANRLFGAFDRYRGEDHIYGQLDGLEFDVSELTVQKRQRNGKRSSTKTIFKGLFFVMALPEPIPTTTLIYPRLAMPLKLFSQYKRARLEDPVFERAFNVYTNDQVGARRQLTPEVMENIMNLKALTKQTPYLSFDVSRLYIAVPSQRNHLEPSLFKSVLAPSTVRAFLAELEMLFSLPRTLQLDANTRIQASTTTY
ncbi:MAG: DUF3137 domain-containing protein [Deinococcota bacterium]